MAQIAFGVSWKYLLHPFLHIYGLVIAGVRVRNNGKLSRTFSQRGIQMVTPSMVVLSAEAYA